MIALDPDPEAIKATVTNIKLNKVEKIVFPMQGELAIVKDERFDLIMANLYGDILLTLVCDIPFLLKPEGYMLLSGIQFEYIFELKIELIRAGCKLLKSRFLEEYSIKIVPY